MAGFVHNQTPKTGPIIPKEGVSIYLQTIQHTVAHAHTHTHSPSPALLLSLSSFERRPGDVDDEMRDER